MHGISIAFGALVAVASAAGTHAEWRTVEDKERGYAAAFPGQPKMDFSDSNGVTKISVVGSGGGVVCLVITADYPHKIDPLVELPASRDSFTAGVKGTLASQEQVVVRRGSVRLPGLQFDVAGSNDDYRSLIVIDGMRAYQVSARAPKGMGGADLDRCVRGFRLLPRIRSGAA